MKEAITFEKFYFAYLRARKNKAGRLEVLKFEQYLEYELIMLMEEIRLGTYCLSNYSSFIIYEPKKREIRMLPFRDRIVHQWYVEEFIKPCFLSRFIFDSYACIPGRGVHNAIKRVQYFMRIMYHQYQNYYILKMDISNFFASIDKDILFSLMKKYFKEKGLLNFTHQMIFEQNDQFGLPIGNYTSQYFANIYLHELDFFLKVKKSLPYYVRYMDDFVILVKNKEEARTLYDEISCFLNEKLHLSLNPKSSYFPSSFGVCFLGFKIYEDHILLLRKIERHMIDKIRKSSLSFSSCYAHFHHANHHYLLSKVEKFIV